MMEEHTSVYQELLKSVEISSMQKIAWQQELQDHTAMEKIPRKLLKSLIKEQTHSFYKLSELWKKEWDI